MEFPPYFCTNQEAAGIAEFFDADGAYVTALVASRCFSDWYCVYVGAGWTWSWYAGIDPDDPTTWPGYVPPEDPPADPEPV